jgi:glycosyltransferase involved in cell wall biosynthesis
MEHRGKHPVRFCHLRVYASNGLRESGRVKILHTVEFYAPVVGGAQEVVRQLSVRMAARGHDVTVATTRLPIRTSDEIDGVKIAGFDVGGNAVRGYTGTDIDRYRSFLREGDFDLVMNYAAQEWAADLFFDVIDEVDARKVFAPCGFSALYDERYEDYFRSMPAIMNAYDATVFHSEGYRDSEFAREHGVANGLLIPNGAGEDEFGEIDDAATRAFRQRHRVEGLLVTTLGNHTGTKGHLESIRAFMRADLSPATLLVLGGRQRGGCFKKCSRQSRVINLASPLNGKRVLLLDLPRAETVQALKASDIFLFLSTIECSPVVLFEAAAAGVPFVTGPAGNAAEVARWTGGGVLSDGDMRADGSIVPSIPSAAAQLEALGRDYGRRCELGACGRDAWRRRYTWERIAEEYLGLYERLLSVGR